MKFVEPWCPSSTEGRILDLTIEELESYIDRKVGTIITYPYKGTVVDINLTLRGGVFRTLLCVRLLDGSYRRMSGFVITEQKKITPEQERAICDKLAEMPERPIAAINLALTGELTDKIPNCMSEVVGNWIIAIQDRMPTKIRDSKEWRELIAITTHTGRERERERLALIMDWMWEGLAQFQPQADKGGFGTEWRRMWRAASNAVSEVSENSVYFAVYACSYLDDWDVINPCGLLERLIK